MHAQSFFDQNTERHTGPLSRFPSVIVRIAVYLVIVIAVGLQLYLVHNAIRDDLSPTADPYSEANSIRAGEYFADKGFLHAYGLADFLYGHRFPNAGVAVDMPGVKEFIYTHYPPGPDWLAGIYTVLLGKGHYRWFRMFPLFLALVSMIVFFELLSRSFGTIAAAFLTVIICLLPMTSHMMHGLHYHSYSYSLLVLQFSFSAFYAAKAGREIVTTIRYALLFGFFGFLQGWFMVL